MDMKLSSAVISLVEKWEPQSIIATYHFRERQTERGLRKTNIQQAILNGEVIESHHYYGIGEKYTIFCFQNNVFFHIVLAYNYSKLYLVTIYLPNEGKYAGTFENDLKIRTNKRF